MSSQIKNNFSSIHETEHQVS